MTVSDAVWIYVRCRSAFRCYAVVTAVNFNVSPHVQQRRAVSIPYRETRSFSSPQAQECHAALSPWTRRYAGGIWAPAGGLRFHKFTITTSCSLKVDVPSNVFSFSQAFLDLGIGLDLLGARSNRGVVVAYKNVNRKEAIETTAIHISDVESCLLKALRNRRRTVAPIASSEAPSRVCFWPRLLPRQ